MGNLLNWILWLPTGFLLGYLWLCVIEQHHHYVEVVAEMEAFRSKGPRFTAIDGDDLCRDIQDLQRLAGVNVRECTFGAGK